MKCADHISMEKSQDIHALVRIANSFLNRFSTAYLFFAKNRVFTTKREVKYLENRGIKRTDLIGQTGSITRGFKVIDAIECNGEVSIRVVDSMGNEFSTLLDDDVSLD